MVLRIEQQRSKVAVEESCSSVQLPEFRYPKGFLLRRVNDSGDISWHKNRVFISEVFRFEELAFEDRKSVV